MSEDRKEKEKNRMSENRKEKEKNRMSEDRKEKERDKMREDQIKKEKRKDNRIKEENYTYIVQCSDGTYYTGWTNNIKKRIDTHNRKKGAKYTRTRVPVQLVYFESFETKEEAMSREYRIKKMSRKQKEEMIRTFDLKGQAQSSLAI